ncbi:MAG: undecaprenyl-phosphate glucose phosphotransferase [Butyrivibrio sp.]|nr:undecaprenyl-phosphate glucose phosphotransferase [Butyrivibrio sp.]
MIRNNQSHFNALHVIGDGIIVIVSYVIAWWLRFIVFGSSVIGGRLPLEEYLRSLYFLVPIYLILYNYFDLYSSKRASRLLYEINNIIKANIAGMICYIVYAYVFVKQIHFSRMMLGFFFVVNVVLMSVVSILLRKILRYARKKGYNIKHILLVGYSRAAEGYILRLTDNPAWGYDITGVLDDYVPIDTSYHGIRVIGKIDLLQELLDKNTYDEIIITLPLDQYERLEDLVAMCEKSGIHTKFVPDYTSLFPSNPYTEDVQGLPVINIRYVPLASTVNKVIKRAMDIVGALVAIIVFSPFMLFAVISIKLTSKGPIIFKQERVGMHGKPFMMYKFRTMEVQTEEQEKKEWTTRNDPRVTKVGHFLRKTSIDEMPQFFNILIGQMSLVGPRPERPQFVEKFKEQIPRYMVKHQVRPGLTGWAQVNGFRGDTSIRKRIEYDIYYIENWSVGFDIKIILGTFRHGFVNKNAY